MIFIIIAVVICALDLAVKYQVEKKVKDTGKTKYLNGKLYIEKHHNKGVFLNFMEKIPSVAAALSGVVIGIMVALFGILLPEKRKTLMKLGFSFALGGAFGNFIDRVFRGYVVDFLRCPKVKPIKMLIFNIADVFVFLGGIFIAIGAMFQKK